MKLEQVQNPSDPSLRDFLGKQVVQGLFDYRTERPQSLMAPHQLTTQDSHAFVLKDGEGQIHALASIVFRQAFINDQEQTVGYLTDLRVSRSREATLNWAQQFVPAFTELRNERNCQFLFSALEQSENKAYNFLLKRRFPSEWMPRYHLFRKFHLVVIYGRPFWVRDPLPSIQMSHAQMSDLQAISEYLTSKSVRRPLRFRISPDELKRRVETWPKFSIENFLIARDSHGQIKGCMAPWDNSDVEKIIVSRYHGKSLQTFGTSNSLSWLGMARPFPNPGQALKLKYLTHTASDNPDIFYALLSHAYEECQNKELLIYPNYDGDFATRPPRSFLSVRLPYGFYSIIERNRPLPDFLHPNPFTPPPDFNFCYF